MTECEKEDTFAANKFATMMIDIADQNQEHCQSDNCILVYGLIRDCGYQIRRILGSDASDRHT
jgi:hypothetical protein